jgi:aspartate 1-decarboxylase
MTMRRIVASKLHGIYVTDSDLNYYGSITLDPEHCEEAGILPLEFVEIWNKHSGARISTYVILGARGSRCCVLNGAAARTCQRGDQLIVCSSTYVNEDEITAIQPTILTFDKNNEIIERLRYEVSEDSSGRIKFSIRELGKNFKVTAGGSRLDGAV